MPAFIHWSALVLISLAGFLFLCCFNSCCCCFACYCCCCCCCRTTLAKHCPWKYKKQTTTMSANQASYTFISRIEQMAKDRPTDDAVVAYNENLERTSLTYSEIYNLSSRFAKILKDAGVCKGDYVIHALQNSLENMVATMGILLAGGVCIPVEIFFSTGETFFDVLKRTEAKFLIVSNEPEDLVWKLMEDHILPTNQGRIVSRLKPLSTKIERLEKTFVIARTDGTKGNVGFLDYLRHQQKDAYINHDVTADDLCMVFSTANSTLLVCLVGHAHGSLVRTAEAFKPLLRGETNFLYDKPTTWVLSTPGDFLVWGLTRVFLDHWSNFKVRDHHELLADVIEKEKVQSTFMLPMVVEAVMEKWAPRPFPMIDHVHSGGMPITEKIVKKIKPSCKALTIRYLSTETPSISDNVILKESDFTDFDAGVLENGVQIRPVDHNLKDLPFGQTGMLLIKSPGIFQRYVGQPAEDTTEKFTADGWYKSGDAGYYRVKEDGHLAVMGRKDDMIVHNVWNIHPSWIEKDIRRHPEVEKVVVVPIPDDDNFQNICACVIKKPGSDLKAEDVQNHFKSLYVDMEKNSFCPSDVVFLDEFPEKSPGQVDRSKLADLATELVLSSRLAEASTVILKNILSTNNTK